MLGMGIDRMVMGMVTVFMGVHGHRNPIGLASAGAFQFTKSAAFSETFDVVVMTLLGLTHVLLKPQHLGSVFTKRAIHRGVTADHVLDPFTERLHHLGVIAEIAGGDNSIAGDPQQPVRCADGSDSPGRRKTGNMGPPQLTETQANDMASLAQPAGR